MRFLTNFQPPRDDKGVSPVVGVVLMVAITVALAAVVGIVVFDIGNNTSQNGQAALTVEQNENTMTIGINTAQTNALDYIYVTSGPNVTYSGGIDGTVDYANGPSDSSQYLYATSESGEQGGAGTQVDANYTNSSDGQVSVIGVNTDGTETVLNSYEYTESNGGSVESSLSRWNHTFENPTYDTGEAVATTSNGNIYIGGQRGTLGGNGAYIQAVNSTGESTLWSRNKTGSRNSVHALSVDSNQNLYAAQEIRENFNDDSYFSLAKINSTTGDEIWNTEFKQIGRTNIPYAMHIDNSDNIYVSVREDENISVFKYNTNGDVLSNVTIENRFFNEGLDIDSDGNIYLAGGAGTAKYSPDGTQLWHKDISSGHVKVTPQGSVYATEADNNIPARVTKYNSSGSELWSSSIPNDPHRIRGLDIGPTGNVYAGGTDFPVAKYSPSGEQLGFIQEYQDGSGAIINDLEVNSDGTIFAFGQRVPGNDGSAQGTRWMVLHTYEDIPSE